VTPNEWGSWQWQMKNAIRTVDHLNDVLQLFTSLRAPSSHQIQMIAQDHFPLKITPHMMLSLKRALQEQIYGAWDAFRSSFIPSEMEADRLTDVGVDTDCIGEELRPVNPVQAVTNFYGNSVVFRVTMMCPAYCRYCFRRRMVGDGTGVWDDKSIRDGLEYISGDTSIHEVIISGGDPLVLSDARLASIVSELRKIPHVRRLRIDTKALTMMPQRITDEFVSILAAHQPFYLIGHFSHVYEITEETRLACARLANAGIPLASHTPLLALVNDSEIALASLMDTLTNCRVRPYYLIHFIPTRWTQQFRVPLYRGIELIQYLQQHCGGLATPTYIVYLPDAGGKVPVSPQYIRGRNKDGYIFENLQGRQILYPEPQWDARLERRG
jgi:lysine 2,3-aminomutase